jgi:hypothetical protein
VYKTLGGAHIRDMSNAITTEQHNVGPTSRPIWFVWVNGKMLRDKRGVGRRFKTKKAAERAAQKGIVCHG